jgi:hypothetical protein
VIIVKLRIRLGLVKAEESLFFATTLNKGSTKWGIQIKNNFLNISIKINIFF